MITPELIKIRKIVCDSFLIEESELSISGKTKCSIKMAQYAFSYYAYQFTMNRHNLMSLVGVSSIHHFDRFMKKHTENLCNPQYRKIAERIELKIKDI